MFDPLAFSFYLSASLVFFKYAPKLKAMSINFPPLSRQNLGYVKVEDLLPLRAGMPPAPYPSGWGAKNSANQAVP